MPPQRASRIRLWYQIAPPTNQDAARTKPRKSDKRVHTVCRKAIAPLSSAPSRASGISSAVLILIPIKGHRSDVAHMSVLRVSRGPQDLVPVISALVALIGDSENTEAKSLIFLRRKAPFPPVCAPVDHSTETRSTLRLVSPRSSARHRLPGITGRVIPGARWLRDQSRSRLNGLRS